MGALAKCHCKGARIKDKVKNGGYFLQSISIYHKEPKSFAHISTVGDLISEGNH